VQLDDDQPGATDSILNGEALKLYGFGDVGYQQMLMPKNSPWFIYLNRQPEPVRRAFELLLRLAASRALACAGRSALHVPAAGQLGHRRQRRRHAP
jgi:hypothetical protein